MNQAFVTSGKLIAVACSLLAASSTCVAWGEQGHRISGLMAQRLLTPEAAAGVKRLMGKVDLAAFALYMDQNKLSLDKRIPGSRQWHYDDKPVCAANTDKGSYCPAGNCSSTQIVAHYRALIDAHSSVDDKRFAIYALVHLVGDVHQPLHASDHDDSGGNDVRVSFRLPSGSHRTTNLHAAWDTDFVSAAFETTDERAIAQRLVNGTSPADLAKWQKGSAATWLSESFKIAHEFAYHDLPGFDCGADDFAGAKLELDDAYVTRAVGLVPTQLAKAGARIAYLLNRAFAR